MRAVITIFDQTGSDNPTIGYTVKCESQPGDEGITRAAYLTHSLTETLQHIAVRIEPKPAFAEPEDRLVDFEAAAWLVWSDEQPKRANFPEPVADNPKLWKRSDIMHWMRIHRPHRIDFDLVQAFIRRPFLNPEELSS